MCVFECENPVQKPFFFNREKELQTLISAVKEVEKGQGRIFLILGSKKMGKTSLIKEFLRICKQSKINFLVFTPTKQISYSILRSYIISVAKNLKRNPTIFVIENIQKIDDIEQFVQMLQEIINEYPALTFMLTGLGYIKVGKTLIFTEKLFEKAATIYLKPITEEECLNFLKQRYKEAGIKFDQDALREIVKMGEDIHGYCKK
ncbi:MAG: AAA family ATPase [Candidatus Baldrarchaeia archaeon]